TKDRNAQQGRRWRIFRQYLYFPDSGQQRNPDRESPIKSAVGGEITRLNLHTKPVPQVRSQEKTNRDTNLVIGSLSVSEKMFGQGLVWIGPLCNGRRTMLRKRTFRHHFAFFALTREIIDS